MKIKLMTYNIQHGVDFFGDKKTINLQLVAETIRENAPDIVVLNEVRDSGPQEGMLHQTDVIADLAGFKYRHFASAIRFSDGGAYGNALLSRLPLLSFETLPIPDPPVKDEDKYYETRCLLKAIFENRFTLLGSHFGLATSEQRNAIATTLAAAENLKNPMAFMGDLNLTPDDPILAPLLERFTDAAAGTPFANKPSWPSDKPIKKLDYIFLANGVKALTVDIPNESATDHLPHTAVVEWH